MLLVELIKIPLSLMPMLLLIGISTLKRITYLAKNPLRDASLPQESLSVHGMHIYGHWANPLYGIYDSFPSHPEVDKALAVGRATGDKELYLNQLKTSGEQPLYFLDVIALRKDSPAAQSFQQLRSTDLDKGSVLQYYRQIASGTAGVLYEYIRP
jgi:hypothetical protein